MVLGIAQKQFNSGMPAVINLCKQEQNEYWELVEIIQNVTGTQWVASWFYSHGGTHKWNRDKIIKPLLTRIKSLFMRDKRLAFINTAKYRADELRKK